jgi:twitching motility protein PilT
MHATADQLLPELVRLEGSDLHLAADNPPMVRLHGMLLPMENAPVLGGEEVADMIRHMVGEKLFSELKETGELDSALELEDGYRLRLNAYRQQGQYAAALRLLPNRFFSLDQLGLPRMVLDSICRLHSGLVLVTGSTSSGKSTTIASVVNEINQQRHCHIHTIEDPIEYRHVSKRAFITQREVGRDTASFAEALRRSMREDPDVIVIGEMRDLETMGAALTLSETGHLTFATLHTSDAVQTVSRIVSQYPAAQQAQVRIQLASTLRYVISQQLVPWDTNAGRSLAAEILVATPAVRALIREDKTHQIRNAIQTGHALGMRTMNQSLLELVAQGNIGMQTAAEYSPDPERLSEEAGPAGTVKANQTACRSNHR